LTEYEYLLGIDIGTFNLKISLWSVDGKLVNTVKREYDVDHPRPLWAEQNPEIWWQALKSASKELVKKHDIESSSIIGIGVSAFIPPLVPLDKYGNVLRSAILSFDQRSTRQAARLRREAGREVFKIAGNRIAPGAFSATSMVWIKEIEPKVFEEAYKFVHASGYIVYKLTLLNGLLQRFDDLIVRHVWEEVE
jgi:xylulokinase